MNPEQKLK